jgi:hypothetical protein
LDAGFNPSKMMAQNHFAISVQSKGRDFSLPLMKF